MTEEDPPCLGYLWTWFCEISGQRQVGVALCGISYSEIEAWASLTATDIGPTEVGELIRIDRDLLLAKSDHDDFVQPTMGERMRGLVSAKEAQRRVDEHRAKMKQQKGGKHG